MKSFYAAKIERNTKKKSRFGRFLKHPDDVAREREEIRTTKRALTKRLAQPHIQRLAQVKHG